MSSPNRDLDTRAETLLPLTAVVFEILLALADGARHGYAIMKTVERRTGGHVALHAGTLYRALARLVDEGLIEEQIGARAEGEDARRRYYALTDLGRRAAQLEASRLAAQVEAARAAALIPAPA